MKSVPAISFCLLALTPLTVQAQIFMCKDAAGKTYTSDRPIPECHDRAVREFDKSGSVRREIPAPLSAEQKRQRQQAEEKHMADLVAADAQKQSDRAIVARFPNEADVEVARKRELEPVQSSLTRELVAVAASEKVLKDAQAEATLPANKKAMPPALQKRLESSEQQIKDQKKRVLHLGDELAQINAKFDAMLRRYRELAGAPAAPAKVVAPALAAASAAAAAAPPVLPPSTAVPPGSRKKNH